MNYQAKYTIKMASATLTISECGHIICDSTNSQTYKLPTSHPILWYRFSNINTGVVTVTDPSDSTIATLAPGESCFIMPANSGWYLSVYTVKQHALDDLDKHIGITGDEDNFMSLDSDGLPKDSGFSDLDFDVAGAASAVQDNLDTHEGLSVIDPGGVHGFESATPTVDDDGKALIWDNTAGKHIYGDVGGESANFTETSATREIYVGYKATLTGTLDASGTAVAGSSTLFTSELSVGDILYFDDGVGTLEYREVDSIIDDDELTLDTALVGTYDDVDVIVVKAGNDANDGTAPDAAHALETLGAGVAKIPDLARHEVYVMAEPLDYSTEDIVIENKIMMGGAIFVGLMGGVGTPKYGNILNSLVIRHITGIKQGYSAGVFVAGASIKGITDAANVGGVRFDATSFNIDGSSIGLVLQGGIAILSACAIDGANIGIEVVSGEVLTAYDSDPSTIDNCTTAGVVMAGGIFHSAGVTMSGNAVNYDTSAGGVVSPTALSWAEYAAQWTTAPAYVETIAAGDVYEYDRDGTSIYRLVPSPYVPANDAFYATFSSPTLSDFIVARG